MPVVFNLPSGSFRGQFFAAVRSDSASARWLRIATCVLGYILCSRPGTRHMTSLDRSQSNAWKGFWPDLFWSICRKLIGSSIECMVPYHRLAIAYLYTWYSRCGLLLVEIFLVPETHRLDLGGSHLELRSKRHLIRSW